MIKHDGAPNCRLRRIKPRGFIQWFFRAQLLRCRSANLIALHFQIDNQIGRKSESGFAIRGASNSILIS